MSTLGGRPSSAAGARETSSRRLASGTPAQSPALPNIETTSRLSQPDNLPLITPENAQHILETRLVINSNTILTPNLLMDLLERTALDTTATENDCRTTMIAVSMLLWKNIVQMSASATVEVLGEQMTSIRKHETEKIEEVRKSSEKELTIARQEGEKTKAQATRLEEARERLLGEGGELDACGKKISALMEGAQSKLEETLTAIAKEKEAMGSIRVAMEKQVGMIHGGAGAYATVVALGREGERTWDNDTWPQLGGGGAGRAGFGMGGGGDFMGYRPPQGDSGFGMEMGLNWRDGSARIRVAEYQRDSQFMSEGVTTDGTNSLHGMTPLDAVKRTNEALDKLATTEGKPELVRVVAVNLAKRGGLLLEMNGGEERNWLTRQDVCADFINLLDFKATYRPRSYPLIAEMVPIEFDISKEDTIRIIEETNDLKQGNITGLRWIRNPERRSAKQRHAHLVVNCRTKQVANQWIKGSMAIAGVNVYSTKMIADPFRCFKCQEPGHKADKCLKEYICGTCGGSHNTKECTNQQKPYCITCKTEGHPTWSKSCPGYVTSNGKSADYTADRFFTYYVTNDEWTWEPLGESTRQRRHFQPARPTMGSLFPPNPEANQQQPQPAPTTPIRPSDPSDPHRYQAVPAPTWSPTAPLAHPRPENLAQPGQTNPGGLGLGLTQAALTGFGIRPRMGMGITNATAAHAAPSPTVE